jgi:hypothetical protein
MGADMPGAKILRERLYPVKINGVNRSAILDSNDNLLAGVTEALGQENEVTIAKMNWLSDKGNGKIRVDGGLRDEGERCKEALGGQILSIRIMMFTQLVGNFHGCRGCKG